MAASTTAALVSLMFCPPLPALVHSSVLVASAAYSVCTARCAFQSFGGSVLCLYVTFPALHYAGIIAYFCPCYVFGKNAEAVGDSCLMCALSQFVPLLNLWTRVSIRGKIREQKGIEVSGELRPPV